MATRYSVVRSAHKTLATTTADTVYFSTQYARQLLVTNRDTTNTLYFSENPGSETQTVTLSAGTATDTFKLSWINNAGGTAEGTAAVTIPTGGYANVTAALMQAAIDSVAGIASGDVTVTKATNDYAFSFAGGLLRGSDVGAITITSKTGAANGSVAETTKGGVVAAAAESIAVLPLQSVAIDLVASSYLVSVIGSGGGYSVHAL